MKRITNSEIAAYIARREPFLSNSAMGRKTTSGYVVTSYDTLIARIEGGNLAEFDNRAYSTTTSKIQNIIADLFGLAKKRGQK